MSCRPTEGSISVSQEADSSEGKVWATTFIMFSAIKARQVKANSLRLYNLSSSSRLWGIGLFLACLVSGSGLIQGRKHIGFMHESKIKEVIRGMDLRLVSLHEKGGSPISCLLSQVLCNPEGQSLLSQQATPPRPIHQNIIKHRK